MEQGNFKNLKSLKKRLFEIKIDYGPGIRVYLMQQKNTFILLYGGAKGTQQKDIKSARELLVQYVSKSKLLNDKTLNRDILNKKIWH